MSKFVVVLLIVLFGQFKSVKIFSINIGSENISNLPLLKEAKNYKRKFPTSLRTLVVKENDGSKSKKSQREDHKNHNIYTTFLIKLFPAFSEVSAYNFNGFRLLWFGC